MAKSSRPANARATSPVAVTLAAVPPVAATPGPASDSVTGISGAAQSAAPDTATTPGPIPVALEVTGPVQGRWRITSKPLKFTDQPTILLLADLSDVDLMELHGDPELAVRMLTDLPADTLTHVQV